MENYIKFLVNKLFFRAYRYRRMVRRHFSRYYTPDAPEATNRQKMIIFMADGKHRHGGLADRLKGITTLYQYCRRKGIDFRIYFVSPFRLEEYLEPNLYDWRIRPEELSFNSKTSHACYLDAMPIDSEKARRLEKRLTEQFLAQPYRQLHVYTNMYYDEEYFGQSFLELFRPVPRLQQLFDSQLSLIRKQAPQGKYLTVSARFMELLGDFKEPKDYPPISAEAQKKLLEGSLNELERIRKAHAEHCIVVTSDSKRFLNEVGKRGGYYIIPGEIAHVDVPGNDWETHAKTFVDFYVIAHAEASFLLIGPGMYHSKFSERASHVFNHPFTEVVFNAGE